MKLILRLSVMAVIVCLTADLPVRGRDLLRAGFVGGNPSAPAGSGATYGATTTNTAKGTAYENSILSRTTQAMQAVQAMQSAARSIAQGKNNLGADPSHPGQQLPNVPNGLIDNRASGGAGGLIPDSGILSPGVANPVTTTWQNAKTPTQTTNSGQTIVTVQQTAQQALLNWQTFNIGLNTTLNIDQSSGGANASQWVAINKVNDPSAIPSQILGSISALGQVYLINQNGIIFGGASQINVHALVASSLPINDNLVQRGLFNNPDDQFLFSQLPIAAGSNGTPAFNPSNPYGAVDGDVTVQAGATISSPTSATHVGGKVALIGPNVTNAGTISTPDGQTILAAGNQVGFSASSDASLRGLNTYIGSVDSTSGAATNSGLISAERANVTLAGKAVNQLGVIDSTTSVAENGSIDLLADYGAISSGGLANVTMAFFPQNTGSVTFGAGSATEILPELSSQDRIIGSSLALSSAVNVDGLSIYMAPNSTLLAPSATVKFNAGNWFYQPSATQPTDIFVNSAGQIYLDSQSVIDVAGSQDVSASVSENIVTAQLLGSELADSPLQRNGALRNQTVQVDILQSGVYNGTTWVGSPIGDLAPYANNVLHTVGELTANGGKVTLAAGDSVVMQAGSVVDVAGGWINYQGANVQTTKVISGGHIYDISQATPDRVYDGVLSGFVESHSKYGISGTFGTPLLGGPYYQAGYVYGGNGGSINVSAPSVALDGAMVGNTVAGPRQRTIAPDASALNLAFVASNSAGQSISPTVPTSVIFESGVTLPAVGAFSVDSSGNPLPLPASRQSEVILSPDLVSVDGFGNLNVNNHDGNITLPANVSLTVPASSTGSITLSAANIDLEGSVIAPGASLSFTVNDLTQSELNLLSVPGTPTPAVDPTRGHFTLGATASLSTAGLFVDDHPGAVDPETLPLVTKGGSVSISGYDLDLEAGSSIDVSGGVAINETNKKSFGAAGSISIKGGQDMGVASLGFASPTSSPPGKLILDATLKGYAGYGANGGTLSIQAALVQIGGNTLLNGDTTGGTLWLQPDFLSQGGFTSFAMSGIGETQNGQYLPAILIAPNTVIEPVAESWQLVTGADGQLALTPTLLPQGVRKAVSLAFSAKGVDDTVLSGNDLLGRGDFVMGSDAVIQTDPLGSVSITGQTVAVLGKIFAPGGSIKIAGNNSFPTNPTNAQKLDPQPTVDLGPESLLSTAGTVLLTPDLTGHNYTTGTVLPGGPISVSGNIVAEAGSIINVSGASGMLDLPVTATGGNSTSSNPLMAPSVTMRLTRVDSNGGSISLSGGEELFSDATLIGNAGGSTAIGGNLSFSSGYFVPTNTTHVNTALDINLVVTQDLPAISVNPGQTVGNPVVDASNNVIPGLGYVAVDRFSSGGFYSVSLAGTVDFVGPVTLSAGGRISVGSSGVIYADSTVTLNAPYVMLGIPFPSPQNFAQLTSPFASTLLPNFAPSFGSGNLNVNAGLIDIGSLSLQNIGSANFIAKGGDIRGVGTLDISGAITLEAGQIYPPTASMFTIAAYDKDVAIASASTASATVQLPVGDNLPPGFGIGSTLLGSTVQSITGQSSTGYTITLASNANANISGPTYEVFAPNSGSVTILASGNRQLPLSAGGELNIYASNITQDGVLRAPIGTINLGWDGTGSAPLDLIVGNTLALPVTQTVTLGSTSITSVSAVDPTTGSTLIIPYGTDPNGTSWIDPTGQDITAGGVAQKTINIAGENVVDKAGATIDLRGGGNLYAYRFLSGTGGSSDILASSTSFAVIPGYQAGYAPFGDSNYTNGSLQIGSQIYLTASSGLPAGVYTLLPARYALLPGAFLVTPESGQVLGSSVTAPDGSNLVPGYRFVIGQTGQQPYSMFEVDSQAVVRSQAQYQNFYANSYLKQGAIENSAAVPRLPIDAGQLILNATVGMSLKGSVLSQAPADALGGLVDISSPNPIEIVGSNQSVLPGYLALDATNLTGFGSGSLLIGGYRTTGTAGVAVTVTTSDIEVNNAGSPLKGADIILVANNSLKVDAGADIESTGAQSSPTETLLLGNSGDGDGTLLRVSSDPTVQLVRSNVDVQSAQAALAEPPTMVVGQNAIIKGISVDLDSTYATMLDPSATIEGKSIALGSGQISLQLDNPGALQPTNGLVLSNGALQTLQANTQNLSLLSYSSIDVYGTGQVGSSSYGNLSLHAAEIRGFNNNGGTVEFDAEHITLDNSAGGSSLGAVAASNGTLAFNANVITLGNGQISMDQYDTVAMNASNGILLTGSGGANVEGALTLATPLITGATAANQTITSTGLLTLQALSGGATSTLKGGLGATLKLQGAGVDDNTDIVLPSGELTLHATGGDLTIGDLAASRLDVGGTVQYFFDLMKYTGGGQINLISDTGKITVNAGSVVNVAANPAAGDAGSLTVSATSAGGAFSAAVGTLLGQGGVGGKNGSFAMDVGTVGGDLGSLENALAAGGFTESQSIRVRSDSNVAINGSAKAHTFMLSNDAGSITISGTVDASGPTGGEIDLAAHGSLILESGALLTVKGQDFDDAGKGGSVTLEAGAETNGAFDSITNNAVLDIQAGSAIDLSVASIDDIANPVQKAAAIAAAAKLGHFAGTLHLRTPQVSGTGVQINPINGQILNPSSIFIEGYQIFVPTDGIVDSVEGSVLANGQTFGANTAAIKSNLTQNWGNGSGQVNGSIDPSTQIIVEPGAEIVNATSPTATVSLTLNSTPGTSISLNADPIVFPLGTPGNDNVKFSIAGTITDSSGKTIGSFAANQNVTVPAGSTVTLSGAGTMSFVTGSGGSIPVTLSNGATYGTTSGATSFTVGQGSRVTLNNTSSSLIIPGGNTIVFPSGAPTGDTLKFTTSGTIVGTGIAFTANQALDKTKITPGSVVKLNSQGTLSFTGSGGAIVAALAGGSYTTGGATSLVASTGGDLTLMNDWNLFTYRFGPSVTATHGSGAAGDLTMRATGNLIFNGSLSDGFDAPPSATTLWQAVLLPAGSQSWSYRLTSGADFAAADFRQVAPLSTLLSENTGSLQLGINAGVIAPTGGANLVTTTVVTGFYQVIRTGVGDIDISSGRDVQLLNQFATIYTAGTQVSDPGSVYSTNDFDVPPPQTIPTNKEGNLGATQQPTTYAAQYSYGGGNVTIDAQEDIEHETRVKGVMVADSERELPINWLYRRGDVSQSSGVFDTNPNVSSGNSIESTTWWVDFSNFFEGVGALGGGNVTMSAGRDINNVDAVIPTNARMPGKDSNGHAIAPDASKLLQLGGGDLLVSAGNNINAGVYYVERGIGTLTAGNQFITNSTRSPSLTNLTAANTIDDLHTWLPTTLFLGTGTFNVSSGSDLLLGPVANPFLLPEGMSNTYWYKTYFSTYNVNDVVNVSSLTGSVTLRESTTLPSKSTTTPMLGAWLQSELVMAANSAANFQPWLRLDETNVNPFLATNSAGENPGSFALNGIVSLMPPTLSVTSFSGDINTVGNITLSPSPTGGADLIAAGSINGVQPNGTSNRFPGGISLITPEVAWNSTSINVSDADPDSIHGPASPFAYQNIIGRTATFGIADSSNALNLASIFDNFFNEAGTTQGSTFGVLQTQQNLHDSDLLHAGDANPVHIYALDGNISGITLFSPKETLVNAGLDITDIGLYLQNNSINDVSMVVAGRDIIAYDPTSPLLNTARDATAGNGLQGTPQTGDIQIGGLGTLEVLAGRNLTLGSSQDSDNGTAGIPTSVGINSIGGARNPALPQDSGANIVVGAGIGGGGAQGLSQSQLDFTTFINQFLNPSSAGSYASRYLPDLGTMLGLGGASNSQVWDDFNKLDAEKRDRLTLDIFYLVLRDSGRDQKKTGNYDAGYAAIAALFPAHYHWQGDIDLTSKEIKTTNGGDISLFAPGGGLTLGDYPTKTSTSLTGNPAADMGILTQDGGRIATFTNDSVEIGSERIFTLRGGDEIIWSTTGDIAAGASSKTVQSAPPTRVLIDPQSGDVKADLAGLATGGGIGVLASVQGVAPGTVDLIAPVGTIDPGDAGIRSSGNINLSAAVILNVSNIQAGGSVSGAPAAPAAPNLGSLTAASNTVGASNNAAGDVTKQQQAASQSAGQQDMPSVITVEVLGYGGDEGGESSQNDDQNRKDQSKPENAQASRNEIRASGEGIAMNRD